MKELTDFKIRCPNCGSTNLRSNDHILATCDVASWSIAADGSLEAEYTDSGTEVYWDTQEPVDEDHPWECADCETGFSEEHLLQAKRCDPERDYEAGEEDDDDEEEEAA